MHMCLVFYCISFHFLNSHSGYEVKENSKYIQFSTVLSKEKRGMVVKITDWWVR